MDNHCMTKNNAIKFASLFIKQLIGKPIAKGSESFKITGGEIFELKKDCYQVLLLAENEEEFITLKEFLVNYLISFEIPFNRQDFGLPEKA